jgi:hypothetical protein
MANDRIPSFEKFWPFYVREHQNKTTRVLHFVGTTVAGLTLGAAVITRRPALVAAALVAGYGPAWIGHFFIEKNRPASFKYPAWSFLADLKMWGKMATGTMDAEVERVLRYETPEPTDAGATEAAANGVHASNLN